MQRLFQPQEWVVIHLLMLYSLHTKDSEKGDTRKELCIPLEKMEELEFVFMLELWIVLLVSSTKPRSPSRFYWLALAHDKALHIALSLCKTIPWKIR